MKKLIEIEEEYYKSKDDSLKSVGQSLEEVEKRLQEDEALSNLAKSFSRALMSGFKIAQNVMSEEVIQATIARLIMDWENINNTYMAQFKTKEENND